MLTASCLELKWLQTSELNCTCSLLCSIMQNITISRIVNIAKMFWDSLTAECILHSNITLLLEIQVYKKKNKSSTRTKVEKHWNKNFMQELVLTKWLSNWPQLCQAAAFADLGSTIETVWDVCGEKGRHTETHQSHTVHEDRGDWVRQFSAKTWTHFVCLLLSPPQFSNFPLPFSVFRPLWRRGWALTTTSSRSGRALKASRAWCRRRSALSQAEGSCPEWKSATPLLPASRLPCMSPRPEGRVIWGGGWCITTGEAGPSAVPVSREASILNWDR